MKCPYCAEEIKDDAVVCKHCQRDFFIILPLLKTLNDMSKRIEVLESEIAQPVISAPVVPAPALAAPNIAVAPSRHMPGLSPLSGIALCVIALVVAHFLIVVQFDLRLPYLRVALFALPLMFGLLFHYSGKRELLWDFVGGLTVAVLSTLAMLVVVSKIDQVSVMPANVGEWRELGYYVSSIAFGFFTGALVRQGVEEARAPAPDRSKIVSRTSRFIAARIAGGNETQLEKNLKRIQTVVSSSIAISSAVISVASGLGITGGGH